jgi:hypothetical protein
MRLPGAKSAEGDQPDRTARPNGPTERKEQAMCANCGCGKPEDRMGDERNILWSEVVASAEANDITPAEAARNIQAMAEQMGAA